MSSYEYITFNKPILCHIFQYVPTQDLLQSIIPCNKYFYALGNYYFIHNLEATLSKLSQWLLNYESILLPRSSTAVMESEFVQQLLDKVNQPGSKEKANLQKRFLEIVEFQNWIETYGSTFVLKTWCHLFHNMAYSSTEFCSFLSEELYSQTTDNKEEYVSQKLNCWTEKLWNCLDQFVLLDYLRIWQFQVINEISMMHRFSYKLNLDSLVNSEFIFEMHKKWNNSNFVICKQLESKLVQKIRNGKVTKFTDCKPLKGMIDLLQQIDFTDTAKSQFHRLQDKKSSKNIRLLCLSYYLMQIMQLQGKSKLNTTLEWKQMESLLCKLLLSTKQKKKTSIFSDPSVFRVMIWENSPLQFNFKFFVEKLIPSLRKRPQ